MLLKSLEFAGMTFVLAGAIAMAVAAMIKVTMRALRSASTSTAAGGKKPKSEG